METSKEHKLQSIDVLEYFSAVNSTEGSFFVPDGSGALIDFGVGKGSFSMPYYGGDYSLRSEQKTELSNNMLLPVFGMTMNDGGIFGIIENASAVASLNVTPKGDATPFGHIYPSFEMRGIDVTDYGASMSIPIYNLFSMELYNVSPKVKYVILDADKNSYSDMADYYRSYLKGNGTLPQNTLAEAPIYIDYLCMITKEATMMGVPYTKKIVLSTIEEIIDSVKTLQESLTGPCVVRLIGYGPEGYEHKIYNKYSIDKRVGTTEQLKQLKALLEKNGGKLYLDGDMQFSYDAGRGFSPSDDSSRYLNRLVVYRGAHDIVTRKYQEGVLSKYYVSPACYDDFNSAFLKSIKKAFGDNLPGISYGSSGMIIGGDYTKDRDIDRGETVALLTAELDKNKKAGMEMMFDNGNQYVLPYSKHIVNTPYSSSNLDIEKISVPFYQSVLHGYISYAGIPQNLSADSAASKLNTISYGGAPYAAFITRDNSLIANTVFETQWYSLSDNNGLESFKKFAYSTADLRNYVANAEISKSYNLTPEVVHTIYSNGVEVYTNYNREDVTVNGVTIPAFNFAIGGNQNE